MAAALVGIRLTPAGGFSLGSGAAQVGTRHAAGTKPDRSPLISASATGQSVTAIGDSVMVASTPALDQELPGIYIDAVVGRQFTTGLQILAAIKARGLLRPVVVFGLGTNGPITTDEVRQLFDEVGPNRRLVLVNTFDPRSWEQGVNSMLGTAVHDHANSVLADWYTTVVSRPYLLWPDGIHPQPAGGIVYAGMLKAAIEQAVSLPG